MCMYGQKDEGMRCKRSGYEEAGRWGDVGWDFLVACVLIYP